MPEAEAAGTATKLIIFTDRTIYVDGYYNGRDVPSAGSAGNNPYNLVVYAIVLDDEGNMLKGRGAQLSGNYNTDSILGHWAGAFSYGDANWNIHSGTHHSDIDTTTDAVNGALASFTDADNDGIYISTNTPLYMPATYYDQHFIINITVTDSGLGSEIYPIMLSRLSCHSGQGNPTGDDYTHSANHNPDDTCMICHHGSEHQFESISEGIPDSFRSNHYGKIIPTDYTTVGPKANGYLWNVSFADNKNFLPDIPTYQWSIWTPGAEYCYSCHYSPNDNGILDMQEASGDRPSCGQATSPAGTTCHTETTIDGTSIESVNWEYIANPGGIPGDNAKISSKSHNHSSNTTGIPCAVCHLDFHNNKLPNGTATGFSINEQCKYCHSDTGPASSSKLAHDSGTVNCKQCHKNETGALDIHLVPVAGPLGRLVGYARTRTTWFSAEKFS